MRNVFRVVCTCPIPGHIARFKKALLMMLICVDDLESMGDRVTKTPRLKRT